MDGSSVTIPASSATVPTSNQGYHSGSSNFAAAETRIAIGRASNACSAAAQSGRIRIPPLAFP